MDVSRNISLMVVLEPQKKKNDKVRGRRDRLGAGLMTVRRGGEGVSAPEENTFMISLGYLL